MMRKIAMAAVLAALLAAPAAAQMHGGGATTATPTPLVDAYGSLADSIIAGKKTEWNLVHAILAGTYAHAEGVMAKVRARLKAGETAQAELETLATLVSQLGTEGDAAVAAVRKRLVEAGHHHHANAENEDDYDPGYVIVTKEMKKGLLAAAGSLGKMAAGGADLAGVEAEWSKVQAEFAKLHQEGGH
jgi:hypothetical protein